MDFKRLKALIQKASVTRHRGQIASVQGLQTEKASVNRVKKCPPEAPGLRPEPLRVKRQCMNEFSNNPIVWRRDLNQAELKGDTCVFFNAMSQMDEGDRLAEFISDLREEGYSVRAVPLDDETVLRYRVFLPAGSRMEDAL